MQRRNNPRPPGPPRKVSIPFSSGQRMQLHVPQKREVASSVSIPFSSGQRMQLPGRRSARGCLLPFQSPFHRVKGCNCEEFSPSFWGSYVVSIPFSSGQRMQRWGTCAPDRGRSLVSIPFSSGQRMQPPGGSGRAPARDPFQSPFHRVKGCNKGRRGPVRIASFRFNPLFIGSKDATAPGLSWPHLTPVVSIPFSSGQRMQPPPPPPHGPGPQGFQSPFHRVKGCNDINCQDAQATGRGVSIPFSSGQRMQLGRLRTWRSTHGRFQSPFHRVKGCNRIIAGSPQAVHRVSIPFSSGQRMQRMLQQARITS